MNKQTVKYSDILDHHYWHLIGVVLRTIVSGSLTALVNYIDLILVLNVSLQVQLQNWFSFENKVKMTNHKTRVPKKLSFMSPGIAAIVLRSLTLQKKFLN